MKDIWNIKIIFIIRTIFISPEFIFFLIMMVINILKIDFFSTLGIFLFKNDNIITTLSLGFPAVLLVYAGRLNKNILQPEDNNKVLLNWPEYSNYKITSYIGLFFTILPILPIFMCWIYKDVYKEYDVGFYYTVLVGMSLISTASLYLAHLNVKEYLDKYK